jgi:hypothetical protein
VQDGVATAEAPASRKDCFGVFCTTYDLKAVSPSGLRLRWWSSPGPVPPRVFAEMLHRLLPQTQSRIPFFHLKLAALLVSWCGPLDVW